MKDRGVSVIKCGKEEHRIRGETDEYGVSLLSILVFSRWNRRVVIRSRRTEDMGVRDGNETMIPFSL